MEKIEWKLHDDICKTLHTLEEDVSQKDYNWQGKDCALRLQILEMENAKYKNLLENFLGKLQNSYKNIADQDEQLKQFEASKEYWESFGYN